MSPSPVVIKSLHALRDNKDFVHVLSFLADERDALTDELITSVQPIRIHQLQGQSALLAEFIRLARGTEAALARLGQFPQL